jgi:hypothetical protein
MPRNTTDPIGCVPSSAAVEKALAEARRRVMTLEYLLEICRGIESRMRGERVDGPLPQQTVTVIES